MGREKRFTCTNVHEERVILIEGMNEEGLSTLTKRNQSLVLFTASLSASLLFSL